MSAFTGEPRGADYHRRQHRLLQVLSCLTAIGCLAALVAGRYDVTVILGLATALLVAGWAHGHDYEEMDRKAEEWRAGY